MPLAPTKHRLRSGLMTLITVLVLSYGGVVAVLYLAQTWLVFPGSTLPSRPLDAPRAPERLALPAADGAELHGMLFAAAGEPDADLVIGFGGNAQDAEELGQDLAQRFRDLHVAVFHYRGYGPSGGRLSEAAVLADALTIHDALIERLAPPRTYAIGVSLGSGVATYLSKQRPLAGLILVTPYDSIEAIAKETYFWLPVSWLLRHRFPSVEHMADNPTPVAVIAAEDDRIVKPRRTEALVEGLPNLVFRETLSDAAHNDIHGLATYDQAIEAALGALRAAQSPKDWRRNSG